MQQVHGYDGAHLKTILVSTSDRNFSTFFSKEHSRTGTDSGRGTWRMELLIDSYRRHRKQRSICDTSNDDDFSVETLHDTGRWKTYRQTEREA